eukprot:3245982-Pyramimonas_sp.AAC.1
MTAPRRHRHDHPEAQRTRQSPCTPTSAGKDCDVGRDNTNQNGMRPSRATAVYEKHCVGSSQTNARTP